MPDDAETIQLLRRQLARLIAQNTELKSRVADLERERDQVLVRSFAGAIASSVRAAEAAIREETGGEAEYVIPEFQVEVRGIVAQQGEDVAIRLPDPLKAIATESMGSIRMKIARVPPPPSTP